MFIARPIQKFYFLHYKDSNFSNDGLSKIFLDNFIDSLRLGKTFFVVSSFPNSTSRGFQQSKERFNLFVFKLKVIWFKSYKYIKIRLTLWTWTFYERLFISFFYANLTRIWLFPSFQVKTCFKQDFKASFLYISCNLLLSTFSQTC